MSHAVEVRRRAANAKRQSAGCRRSARRAARTLAQAAPAFFSLHRPNLKGRRGRTLLLFTRHGDDTQHDIHHTHTHTHRRTRHHTYLLCVARSDVSGSRSPVHAPSPFVRRRLSRAGSDERPPESGRRPVTTDRHQEAHTHTTHAHARRTRRQHDEETPDTVGELGLLRARVRVKMVSMTCCRPGGGRLVRGRGGVPVSAVRSRSHVGPSTRDNMTTPPPDSTTTQLTQPASLLSACVSWYDRARTRAFSQGWFVVRSW